MSTSTAAPPRRGRPGRRRWTPFLYILPGFAIYAVFVLWPIVDTLRYSFFAWDGFTAPVFNGVQNYVDLLQDPLFHIALRNSLVFILFYSILPIVLGLILTMLLVRRRIFGLVVFRAGLFVPYILSMVVVGVVWRWIYNPSFGPLNQLLRAVGLDLLARPWLGDFTWALPAVGFVGMWVQYGFCMVLFIAGAQRIDETLYVAAKIDGAGETQQLWNITLPGLRGEISVALVTTLIAALRVFDLIFVTTRGGPGNQTTVVAMLIYDNAFVLNRAGYAAAIAVVLTLIILAISYAVLAVRMRYMSQED
ncbi:MAG: sugar ABC transporter permease [Anaerolineales bacterium]|nr:sugar ABC transporter permease [Anaerolineales bacterium]